MNTTYTVRSVNPQERWIFIASDDDFEFEEPDAFVCLLKRIQKEVGGPVHEVGPGAWKLPEDGLGLRYQWDSLFGITVVYPPEASAQQVLDFLSYYF
ncbi:MAG: hypothetical protein IJ461_04870 [Clostridia bacterium]|nr:hypothetical protein [Clostridia bacterium]